MKTKKYSVLIMVLLLTMIANFAAFAQECGTKSYTIGAYASDAHGGNGGAFLDANFATVFPTGFAIGCGNNTIQFNGPHDVRNFLGMGGGPAAYLPTHSTLSEQLVGATLNMGFFNLGDEIFTSGPFAGTTVKDFLNSVNQAIGGCPTGASLENLTTWATNINENYDNKNGVWQNLGYLSCCTDTTPPVITLAAAGTLACNPTAEQIAAAFGAATVTDNVSTGLVASGTVGTETGSGCSYSTTKTWTVKDGCGNSSTASQTVTYSRDTEAPVITASGSASVLGCNPSAADIDAALGSATATDNCSVGDVSATTGDVVVNGCSRSQTRTFSVSDGCGNAAVPVSRTVTWTSDTEKPVITATGTTLTLGCNPSAADIDAALGSATATDNCSVGDVSATTGDVVANGCSRSQTRNFNVSDGCGNAAVTVSRTVTWTSDTEKPVITLSPSKSLACNPTPDQINAAFGTASVTDNCSSSLVAQIAGGDITSSVNCDGTYTITRNWTVTDACGNTGTASQVLTVNQITCNYTTVTQGGWGAKPSGNNWGTYLYGHFAASFPNGFTIGNTSGARSIKITSASAVQAFLPNGGTPRALSNTTQLVNPTSKSLANTLAGQTAALTLNVTFFSNSASLVVLKGAFAGQTVSQMLAIANAVLGGSTAYSASSVNEVLNNINQNFDDGNGTNHGYLGYCVGTGSRGGNVASAEEILRENPNPISDFVNVTAYPNPFVDRIKINFTVEETSHVNLQLYNSSGASVHTLYDGVAEKGVQYNTEYSSTMPGMYIYRMSTAHGVISGKVIQIK